LAKKGHISTFLFRKNVHAFLKTKFFKDAVLFLFFGFVAFGFWVLQTLQQDFEISTPINIQYKNLPDGYVLTGRPVEQLEVTVRDKGSALLAYVVGNKFAPIELNLSDSRNGIINFDPQQLESIISKQLVPTTNLVKIAPDSINVHYARLDKKRVPVRFAGEAIPQSGYMLDKPVATEPQFIEVYAPAAVLDTLSYIPTEGVRFNKIAKKLKRDVKLKFPPNVTSKTTNAELTISVEAAAEKKIEVPVSIDRIPKNLNVKLFPSKIEVSCRLPLSKHNQLSASDFRVEVSYSDIVDNKNGWVIAKITRQPDYVDFTRLLPSRIDFILEERK